MAWAVGAKTESFYAKAVTSVLNRVVRAVRIAVRRRGRHKRAAHVLTSAEAIAGVWFARFELLEFHEPWETAGKELRGP